MRLGTVEGRVKGGLLVSTQIAQDARRTAGTHSNLT